jgi:hypothetical protein
MMTGIDAITVHGYLFDEPVVVQPTRSFDLTPYLIIAGVALLAWKKGWLHKGVSLSPKLQSGGDAGGGMA